MTNRRDVLRMAGAAALATIAPAAADEDGGGAGGGDTAVLSLLPSVYRAHTAWLAALDAFGRAEERYQQEAATLAAPAKPPHGPRSAWGSDPLPIINGRELPTSRESDWAAYYKAEAGHVRAVAHLKRKHGLKRLNNDVCRAGDRLEAAGRRVLAERAHTPAGIAAKLRLEHVMGDPADILHAIRADIEAATGQRIIALA